MKVPILEVKNGQMKLKIYHMFKLLELVKELVRAGYPIFRVVREKESLEDIFLTLTKEA